LDRLRTLRYVSPSGKEFTADFDDLQRAGGKKNAVHELPQQDKAIVQDLGQSAHRFNLSLYFSGPDYDKTADAFFEALGEPGPGTLSHPRWGDISVLALTYAQKEQFVDGIGRAVFDIDFVHAAKPVATLSAISTAAAIKAHAASVKATASAAFAKSFGSPALAQLAATKTTIVKSIKGAKSAMLKIVGSTSDLAQSWNADILSTINDLDTLIQSPAMLADAVLSIASVPAQAAGSINSKLLAISDAYASLPTDAAALWSQSQAAFMALFGIGLAAGAAESVADGSLSSRAEALAAHDNLVAHYRTECALIESAEGSGFIADPETLSSLAALSAEAAAYLLETSFSLRIERRVTLDAAATPLALVYRFYGNLDRLDEWCDQNHLQGDELLIVPMGREVRYYVA
jgi:prophage DNA circulation protein